MISDLKNMISEKKNEIIIGVLIAIIIALWSKIVGLLSYLYWLSFFKRCRIAMHFCDEAIIPYEDRVLLSGTAVALCLSIIIVLFKTKDFANKVKEKQTINLSFIAVRLVLYFLFSCAVAFIIFMSWGHPWYGCCILALAGIFVGFYYYSSAFVIDFKRVHIPRLKKYTVIEAEDKNKTIHKVVVPDQNEAAGKKGGTVDESRAEVKTGEFHTKQKDKSASEHALNIGILIGHTFLLIVAVLLVLGSIFLYGGFKNNYYSDRRESPEIPVKYCKEVDEFKLKSEQNIQMILFETDNYYYTLEATFRESDDVHFRWVTIHDLYDYTLLDKDSITVGTLHLNSTGAISFNENWAPPTYETIQLYLLIMVCFVVFSASFLGLTIKRPDDNSSEAIDDEQQNE